MLQIHEQLLQNYTHISVSDIQENDAKMKAPIKIDDPIEDLFEQVYEGQELAVAGESPYSNL